MTHDQVSLIHEDIEATQHELRLDLYRNAARYAALRTSWHLSSRETRGELDGRRTVAHNALIDATNVLSRNLANEGRDVSWRNDFGDERKVIGDFAVFLAAKLAILVR